MGDKIIDTTQVINGLAVMLSFFVGYKYAAKRAETAANASSSSSSCKNSPGDDERLFSSFDENYKMVLVVRNDLKMGKGKIAAQCSHGAVGAYQQAVKRTPHLVRSWESTGCAKIALKVESEAELMTIKRAADQNRLNSCLIRDAGRTQIAPNSKTVLAIGPAAVDDIDRVTSHLKLL